MNISHQSFRGHKANLKLVYNHFCTCRIEYNKAHDRYIHMSLIMCTIIIEKNRFLSVLGTNGKDTTINTTISFDKIDCLVIKYKMVTTSGRNRLQSVEFNFPTIT